MLHPSNEQGWIENQKQQVRSESDILINVYDRREVIHTRTSLTKKKLESFSIRQNCSALGFSLPESEINFTFFKDGTTENYIDVGDVINIYYRYKINNEWVSINAGVFEISKFTIQNNGLVAKVEAKTLGYKLLEMVYPKGIKISGNLGANIVAELNSYLHSIDSDYSATYTGDNHLFATELSSATTLGKRNVLSIISAIAQASGCRFNALGHIDWDNEIWYVNFSFTKNNTYSIEYTYELLYFNQTKKPESIDSEYAFDGYEITEYVENYFFESGSPYFDSDDLVEIELSSEFVNKGFKEYTLTRFPFDDTTLNPIFYVYNEQGQDVSSSYTKNIETFNNGFNITTSPSIANNYTVKIRYYAYRDISVNKVVSSGKNVISIDNPFITTRNNITTPSASIDHSNLSSLIGSINALKEKRKIIVECRIDPRVQVGDVIIVETSRDEYNACLVETLTINYNGSYNGKMELLILSSIESYWAKFYNGDETIMKEEILWDGQTPTQPSETPTKDANYNAVYTFEFDSWSPTIEPIDANTSYYPTFNNVARTYNKVVSEPSDTFAGQILRYTQTHSGNRYYHTPHIIDFENMTDISTGGTIPAKTGSVQTTVSITTPTTMNGGTNHDDWQGNRIFITRYKERYELEYHWCIFIPRKNQTPLALCQYLGTGGLWYGMYDFRQSPTSTKALVKWDTLDALLSDFHYDATNDNFVFKGSSSGNTSAFKDASNN